MYGSQLIHMLLMYKGRRAWWPQAFLLQTLVVGSYEKHVQGDVGRIMVILLTDGRANVSLAKSNDDPDATKLSQVMLHPHSSAYLIPCKR